MVNVIKHAAKSVQKYLQCKKENMNIEAQIFSCHLIYKGPEPHIGDFNMYYYSCKAMSTECYIKVFKGPLTRCDDIELTNAVHTMRANDHVC